MRPGCWSSPASSMCTRTRASRPMSSPIASSRIPWPRRTAARPRSSRSTTPGRARHPPPSARCAPGSPSGERRRTTTAPSTTGCRSRSRVMPTSRSPSCPPRSTVAWRLEGVHGVRLPPRRPDAVRCAAGHGRARRHAPGPLRGSRAARLGDGRRAAAWRHRSTLSRRRQAAICRGRRHGAGARVRARDGLGRARRAPLIGRGARRGAPRQGGRRPRHRRDVSALLDPHRGALPRA